MITAAYIDFFLKIKTKIIQSQTLIFSDESSVSQKMQPNWFDSSYWKTENRIVGQAKGRFITWFIKPLALLPEVSNEWVLRHYYRGGMIAKVSKDRFFYTGIKNTRCYLEVDLLIKMLGMSLPVPKPIGARVIKKDLFYQADLLMEKIDATDLCGILKKRELSNKEWKNIGEVIAKFHSNGVYHSDLNAHNVMQDSDGKIWLIDFDRCEIRKNELTWQQQNLARLKRSFLKEKALYSTFYFDEDSWCDLMKGYQT